MKNKTESVVDPPFIPLTGSTFAHQLALELMNSTYQSMLNQKFIHQICFLEDVVSKSFFYLENISFHQELLHEGKYPCYSFYRTKDGSYLAVAAIEDKFWKEFLNIFQLPEISPFDENIKNFELIATKVGEKTTEEIKKLIDNKSICVDLVSLR